MFVIKKNFLFHFKKTISKLVATNWHDYEEGIYDGCDYNSNIDINHVVVLVGYGSDSNGDYWLVRNSW